MADPLGIKSENVSAQTQHLVEVEQPFELALKCL
jgi:hypothetical protein